MGLEVYSEEMKVHPVYFLFDLVLASLPVEALESEGEVKQASPRHGRYARVYAGEGKAQARLEK